ncbi:hypothetical protein [Pelobium manganitolerans]|uniref:hypothetical protein n=1 Tax=Pelobium manganitolerans TaxID=1842495 RepID=UPI003FA3DDF0
MTNLKKTELIVLGLTELKQEMLEYRNDRKDTTVHNSKFAQKWLTAVQLRFFVNYLVQCGTTSVLQAMPFMRKFANRYRQMFPERNASVNESFSNAN